MESQVAYAAVFVCIFIQSARCTTVPSTTAIGDPCDNPRIMDAGPRMFSIIGNGSLCDNQLEEGWYKFEINGHPAEIPRVCLKHNICGTQLPLRIDLGDNAMPVVDNVLDAHACTSYNVLGLWDCCVLRQKVRIKNCGAFYVYRLQATDRCPVAYCAQEPNIYPGSEMTLKRGEIYAETSTRTTNVQHPSSVTGVTAPFSNTVMVVTSEPSNSVTALTADPSSGVTFVTSNTSSSVMAWTADPSNSVTAIRTDSSIAVTAVTGNSSTIVTTGTADSSNNVTPVAADPTSSVTAMTVSSSWPSVNSNSTSTAAVQRSSLATDTSENTITSSGTILTNTVSSVQQSSVTIHSTENTGREGSTTTSTAGRSNSSTTVSVSAESPTVELKQETGLPSNVSDNTPVTIASITQTTLASNTSDNTTSTSTTTFEQPSSIRNIEAITIPVNQSIWSISQPAVTSKSEDVTAATGIELATTAFPNNQYTVRPSICASRGPSMACPDNVTVCYREGALIWRECLSSRGCGKICDGRSECRDGSDELNTLCGICGEGAVAEVCPDNISVCFRIGTETLRRCEDGNGCGTFCNNIPDCDDGSDEGNMCNFRPCSEGQSRCSDGMSCYTRCDGRQECDNPTEGEDEWNCQPVANATINATDISSHITPWIEESPSTSYLFTATSSRTSFPNSTSATLTSSVDSSLYSVTDTTTFSTTHPTNLSTTTATTSTISHDEDGYSSGTVLETTGVYSVQSSSLLTGSSRISSTYTSVVLVTSNLTSSITNTVFDIYTSKEFVSVASYSTESLSSEVRTSLTSGLVSTQFSVLQTDTSMEVSATLDLQASEEQIEKTMLTSHESWSHLERETLQTDFSTSIASMLSQSSRRTTDLMSEETTRIIDLTTISKTTASPTAAEATSTPVFFTPSFSSEIGSMLKPVSEIRPSQTHTSFEHLTFTDKESATPGFVTVTSSTTATMTSGASSVPTDSVSTGTSVNHTDTDNATVTTVVPSDDETGLYYENFGLFVFLVVSGAVLAGITVFGLVVCIYQRKLRTWDPSMAYQDAYIDFEKYRKEKRGVESPIPDFDILRDEKVTKDEEISLSQASTLALAPTPGKNTPPFDDKYGDNSPETMKGDHNSMDFQNGVPPVVTGHTNEAFEADDSFVNSDSNVDGIVPVDLLDTSPPRTLFPWIENAEDTKL